MSELKANGFFFSWRYLPFFISQITGSLSDNFFKQALLLFIAYKLTFNERLVWLDVNFYNNMAALIMILPFFLFSVLAGQVGEKYPKHIILRVIKCVEVAIVIIASIGFIHNNLLLIFVALFAMGMHSTFLGPVKYAILPQILPHKHLLSANSYLETGSYLSIVLSTLLAGIILSSTNFYLWLIGCFLVCSISGCIASFLVPQQAAADNKLTIKFNVLTQTYHLLKFSFFERNKFIRYAIVFCSYFWFLGVLYTTQLANFVKHHLGGGELTTTFLLLCFSAGLAVGTYLCHKLSKDYVEIALVPLGALIFTVFGFFLWWHAPVVNLMHEQTSLQGILKNWTIQKIAVDLIFIGLGGGLFLVPLNVLLQVKTSPKERSQIISANYIVNSAFMVLASIFAIVVLNVLWLGIGKLFLLTAVLNLLILLTLLHTSKYYLIRYLIWLLTLVFYRVKILNEDNISSNRPTILLVNNSSKFDAILIASLMKKPVKFILSEHEYQQCFFKSLLKTSNLTDLALHQTTKEFNPAGKARDDYFISDDNHFTAIFWNTEQPINQLREDFLQHIANYNDNVIPLVFANPKTINIGRAIPTTAISNQLIQQHFSNLTQHD